MKKVIKVIIVLVLVFVVLIGLVFAYKYYSNYKWKKDVENKMKVKRERFSELLYEIPKEFKKNKKEEHLYPYSYIYEKDDMRCVIDMDSFKIDNDENNTLERRAKLEASRLEEDQVISIGPEDIDLINTKGIVLVKEKRIDGLLNSNDYYIYLQSKKSIFTIEYTIVNWRTSGRDDTDTHVCTASFDDFLNSIGIKE